MVTNLELFLIISNSIVIGSIGYIFGLQKYSSTNIRKMHPDYLDTYGNTILETDEPDFNGVILYDEDTDPDGFTFKK